MKKWKSVDREIAILKFNKNASIREISEQINKSTKAVSHWLNKNGYRKCPNYSETEIYLLLNFNYKACAIFIPHKSLNALKIKQWRLKKHIK